ncbi:unnamed protein product [Paramecium octaurelia]|uniref:Uncharacterized protein n=1 Tax=Paramecium octaurelia TaxID=43137 RepID=A0A8S1VDN9_PAROT|nr:unnamed protein product [Paramecium octaurelia]
MGYTLQQLFDLYYGRQTQIRIENLDIVEKTEEWKMFSNYNTLYYFLGSRVKEGNVQFTKVDLNNPIFGCNLAKANVISHYSLLTSIGADKGSYFYTLEQNEQLRRLQQNNNFHI